MEIFHNLGSFIISPFELKDTKIINKNTLALLEEIGWASLLLCLQFVIGFFRHFRGVRLSATIKVYDAGVCRVVFDIHAIPSNGGGAAFFDCSFDGFCASV